MGHLVYSLVPGKGYGSDARAQSPGSREDEFKSLTNRFTPPFTPRIFGDDGMEARAVVCSQTNVYVVRFLWCGEKYELDERSRAGLVWHAATVPRALLDEGLTLKKIDREMAIWLQERLDKNVVPIGPMEAIPVSWDKNEGPDEDLAGMKESLSKESAERIAKVLRSGKAKIFVRMGDGKTLQRGAWTSRAGLTFNLAKFVIKAGWEQPLLVASEAVYDGSLPCYRNLVMVSSRDPYYVESPDWTYVAVSGESGASAGAPKAGEVIGDVYDKP